MTWDMSLLKKKGESSDTRDELERPPDDDLLAPPDTMATQALYESMLEEVLAPEPPSFLEREEYSSLGLIHPGDLPAIRRAMTRGLYSVTGFLSDPDPWPIDDESL